MLLVLSPILYLEKKQGYYKIPYHADRMQLSRQSKTITYELLWGNDFSRCVFVTPTKETVFYTAFFNNFAQKY